MPLFSEGIEKILSTTAGLLIFSAQVVVLRDIYKRKISPGILSWLGWALLMGTSFIAQTTSKGWQWSLMGLLISTMGCFIISFSAWALSNFLIKRSDWNFLVLGLLCMVIYLVSKDPWLTTAFAILADFIVGIPTLRHAYEKPATQKTRGWTLGFISWSVSLIICIGHSPLYAMFPIYLFLYNAAMLRLTHRKLPATQQGR